MIEGWSNDYCSQFGERKATRFRNPNDCPPIKHCRWNQDTDPSLCIGVDDRELDPPTKDWRQYLEDRQYSETLEPTFSESRRRFERTLEEAQQQLRQNKERQERERETEELERLEANMNTPPVSPPESPRLDELRGILRKPETEQRQPERLYPEVSGNIPTLDVLRRTRVQRRTQPVPQAEVVDPRNYPVAQPVPQAEVVDPRNYPVAQPVSQAEVVDPRNYPVAQPVPQAEVVPPYQRDSKQQNIFLKMKYYFITPDQYDFDPNSNVPRGSGMVRSVGRNRPVSNTPKKKTGVSGRIQKKPTPKKLDKPARPEKIVKEKIKSPPLDFNKTLNQLLPIILIFAIAIYLFFNLRKWNKPKI